MGIQWLLKREHGKEKKSYKKGTDRPNIRTNILFHADNKRIRRVRLHWEAPTISTLLLLFLRTTVYRQKNIFLLFFCVFFFFFLRTILFY